MKAVLFFAILIMALPAKAQKDFDEFLEKRLPKEVHHISPETLKMKLHNEYVLLIDARSKKEYEVSHLKNSVFLNFNKPDFSMFSEYDKNTAVVVYCSVGLRSSNISKKLTALGFKNVSNLFGGIFKWKNSGYQVVDMDLKATEKVHGYSQNWSKWLTNAEIVY